MLCDVTQFIWLYYTSFKLLTFEWMNRLHRLNSLANCKFYFFRGELLLGKEKTDDDDASVVLSEPIGGWPEEDSPKRLLVEMTLSLGTRTLSERIRRVICMLNVLIKLPVFPYPSLNVGLWRTDGSSLLSSRKSREREREDGTYGKLNTRRMGWNEKKAMKGSLNVAPGKLGLNPTIARRL